MAFVLGWGAGDKGAMEDESCTSSCWNFNCSASPADSFKNGSGMEIPDDHHINLVPKSKFV